MNVIFKIIHKCVWCEKKEIPLNKMICSKKCFKELRQAMDKQGLVCGHDMDDVVREVKNDNQN